jgi:hypothetical protein
MVQYREPPGKRLVQRLQQQLVPQLLMLLGQVAQVVLAQLVQAMVAQLLLLVQHLQRVALAVEQVQVPTAHLKLVLIMVQLLHHQAEKQAVLEK